jgi:hypothetical protein
MGGPGAGERRKPPHQHQPSAELEIPPPSAGLYRHGTAYIAHDSTACRPAAIYTVLCQFHQQCGPNKAFEGPAQGLWGTGWAHTQNLASAQL